MSRVFVWLVRLSAASCLCVGLQVQAADVIGTVKIVEGTVTVSGDDRASALSVGQALFRNDRIETTAGASVGVTFIDDSTLSLGENAAIVLDELVFNPVEGQASFSADLLKGTLAFVSGRIARLKPENFKITTPTMTIGVRGTSFVVKVEEGE